jgi:2-polyprenyl-3-methyl-5-hydroxy-6-metoxy-1,4-benzoquinol methylase
MPSATQDYTPALGHRALTPLYDFAIATMTREGRWRGALLRQAAPRAGERILDIGCGTGTLTRVLKRAAPDAVIMGVDPDPDVLARARRANVRAGMDIPYYEGFFDEAFATNHGPFDKIVSSLVLHQVPLEGKRTILRQAFAALKPGGAIHIADYGLQRSRLMRFLFRHTVQRIDGVRDTEPNARGILPELMTEAGFSPVQVTRTIHTPTGSISLLLGGKP